MKHSISQLLSLLLAAIILFGCKDSESDSSVINPDGKAIAFMPDVHFHDVFANFDNDELEGLLTFFKGEVRPTAIRTMEAQLTSTRLFNENYFAFVAALDDAVERGIKIIGLPGDFSDDGQPVHVRGLAYILNYYRDEYELQFFMAPGNHDPNRPFTQEAGKTDYLGTDGRAQPVFSKNHPYCSNSLNRSNSDAEYSGPEFHDVLCTDEVKELGYEGLLGLVGEYGLYPNEKYLYYETPFSSYDQASYTFDRANSEAEYPERLYEICHEGSGGVYRKANYTRCFDIMDMSYLVEPVEGLWLMSIDANVYIPHENADSDRPENPANFSGSGNSGYNRVLTHKQHLLDWIEDVADRAEENDKTLIAFSHFPAIDFYNRARVKIEQLWGEGRFQVQRIPSENTSKVLAETGLKLHIAGHMHMNDTGIADHNHVNKTSAIQDDLTGNILFNIQVPSLAAYVPAYKIIYLQEDKHLIEVETVVMEEVPDFDTLFSHYQDEWNYLDSEGYDRNWNRDILLSSGYYEFTDWHIKELSRLRFLPREWPEDIRLMLTGMNGRDMLTVSHLDNSITITEYKQWMDEGGTDLNSVTTEFAESWRIAEEKAEEFAVNSGVSLSEFESWDGTDLSVDFYRLRNADELAFRDISDDRFEHYSLLAKALAEAEIYTEENSGQIRLDELFKQKFRTIFEVMHLFSDGLPGDNFILNLKNGNIDNLSEKRRCGLF